MVMTGSVTLADTVERISPAIAAGFVGPNPTP
jgi:hypothetical protein